MSASGGVAEAVDIGRSSFALGARSATFHGRDLFAPVAAALAAGHAVAEVGEPIEPTSLVALERTRSSRDEGTLVAHVQYVDQFGNLQLDAEPRDITWVTRSGPVEVSSSAWDRPPLAVSHGATFADVGTGELVLYEDAHRRPAIGVNRGSAAERLGLGVGDELRISRGRTRRGEPPAGGIAPAAPAPRRFDQCPRARAGRRRGPARDGRHRDLPGERPRPAGTDVGRPRRAGVAVLGGRARPTRLLPLVAGVAVAETVEAVRLPDPISKIWQEVETGDAAAVALKWANDVHLRGRKVAGILVEGRPQEQWAVVGVGLNVAVRVEDFPPELRLTAATIGLEPASIPPTLAQLMQSLGRWLAMPERAVLDAFRICYTLIARQLRWTQGADPAATR